MPDNNPLIEAFKYLFTGSPQQGAGLFSLQNIGNAMGRTGQEIQTIMTPTPPPPVVLEPIRVFGQRQAQASVPQPPAGINMPSGQQQRQPINWQAIADIGIPALSALIGSVAPGTLPAAAGISTGYTGVREKQRETEAKQKNLEKLMGIKAGVKKTPSKESLLRMAQNEAFRQMGGSAFGGIALQDPKKKATYESLVKSLYDSYVSQFIGENDDKMTQEEGIDTTDDLIEKEWNDYQSGNL